MSKHWSYVTLGVVTAVFLIGIADITFTTDPGWLPDEALRLAAVVLSGVAIGSILGGLRNGNGNGHDADPDDATGDRSRQSARIARQEIDDHDQGSDT